VRRVLHVLPHRGGGAETYIDLLEGIEGFVHARLALSTGRTPASAATSLAAGIVRARRGARGADIVHVHGDVAAALAHSPLSGRPWVWTTHGLHFMRRASGPKLRAIEYALGRAIATAGATICTSQAEHDELLELAGESAGRLRVVRNGIELPALTTQEARATARAELGVAQGELCVLFLGELEPRKRPLDAVAAAQRAREGGAPVVLLVAGEGPQADAVGDRAGDAVRPLGRRRDVNRLLAAADALVMPSEREGLSFAVLEAMGAGLALVVSDGPGNPEAVGDAGIVVPLGEIDALADVLAGLAARPLQARRIGAAGRQRVATALTADAFRGGVAAAYAQAQAATAPDRAAAAGRA